MKIRELKENEPLKVTRVTYHFPAWPDPSTGKVDRDAKPIEDERIKTIIFTDGEIEKQTEETFQSIDEFYIGKSKFNNPIRIKYSPIIMTRTYNFNCRYIKINIYCIQNSDLIC